MKTVVVKYFLYTHYTNGIFSDFRGFLLADNTFVSLKDIPALFKTVNVLNVCRLEDGRWGHKSGTPRYYNKLYDKVNKINKIDKDKSASISGSAKTYLKGYKRRDCFNALYEAYITNDARLTALYGVRRTGKTVLMRQVEEKIQKQGYRTLFLTCTPATTMNDVYDAMDKAVNNGVVHIFIDEITFIKDFLSNGYRLGNEYAPKLYIMITGTNSFVLRVAGNDMLFDRMKVFSTTYISFAEFNRVLGHDFDTYVKSGGLMYNGFKSYSDTHTYENTAIIENFTAVFNDDEYCRRHPDLFLLYQNNTLSWYINRIIESNVKDTLTKVFDSSILGSTLHNCREQGVDIDKDLLKSVHDTYRYHLQCKSENFNDILDVEITKQIKGYLQDIGVLYKDKSTEFISIPGLLYSLSLEMLSTIFEAMRVSDLQVSDYVFKLLCTKLEEGVEGDIIENIVYYYTAKKFENTCYSVFKYRTADNAEFDVVVANQETGAAELYEVKRSSAIVQKQARHLLNKETIKRFKLEKYPIIASKTVLYGGKTQDVEFDGELIKYKNVQEYLLGK